LCWYSQSSNRGAQRRTKKRSAERSAKEKREEARKMFRSGAGGEKKKSGKQNVSSWGKKKGTGIICERF